MKKLLALVLCVMLFVSVVPSAAYAELSGSAVDLSAAYQKLQELNVAYAKLGAATAYKNGFDGFKELSALFNEKDNPIAKTLAATAAQLIGLIAPHNIKNISTGLSYKGLAEKVGLQIFNLYGMVGQGVVFDAANKAAELEAKILADVAKEITKVEGSIDKAMSDALSGIKVPEVA